MGERKADRKKLNDIKGGKKVWRMRDIRVLVELLPEIFGKSQGLFLSAVANLEQSMWLFLSSFPVM